MAVDTAAKRYSLVGLAAPVPSLLPIPDGTVEAADRAHLLWLYSGIALGTPTVAVAVAGTVRGVGSVGTVLGVSTVGTIQQ